MNDTSYIDTIRYLLGTLLSFRSLSYSAVSDTYSAVPPSVGSITATYVLSDEQVRNAFMDLYADAKIQLVKAHRQRYDSGLQEALDAVNALYAVCASQGRSCAGVPSVAGDCTLEIQAVTRLRNGFAVTVNYPDAEGDGGFTVLTDTAPDMNARVTLTFS